MVGPSVLNHSVSPNKLGAIINRPSAIRADHVDCPKKTKGEFIFSGARRQSYDRIVLQARLVSMSMINDDELVVYKVLKDLM